MAAKTREDGNTEGRNKSREKNQDRELPDPDGLCFQSSTMGIDMYRMWYQPVSWRKGELLPKTKRDDPGLRN